MRRILQGVVLVVSIIISAHDLTAQVSDSGIDIYEALKRFDLDGGAASVENVVLQRDRARISFTKGVFYFESPVAGQSRSAVFIGTGNVRVEVPQNPFEKEHVRRMLGADVVESDFETAVLRFTDDTFSTIGESVLEGSSPSAEALEIAGQFEQRVMKETGANIAGRLAVSIVNAETPGFFMAQFDKGRRGRFSLVLDQQSRIPATAFGINGGEKGLIYAYNPGIFSNDVWLAFYSSEDYQRGRTNYSDIFDLVAIKSHQMQVDLREPRRLLKYRTELGVSSLTDNVGAAPLQLNEGLTERNNERLRRALRVKSVQLAGGGKVDLVQEDWQGGLILFFSERQMKGASFSLILEIEGDFMDDAQGIPNSNYPTSNETWFPRHGELARSTFDLTFTHKKNRRVSSIGALVREEPVAGSNDDMVTQWRMDVPVPAATFGIGPFERHVEKRQLQNGGALDVEFYSLPGSIQRIKEDFILAELGNTVNYFNVLFGAYPYPRFRALLHPYRYGIGYPSMLRIPNTDRANKYTYSFLAHETAHQWWGNIVAWRSYRDQWLSEGFAEYSGILYTGRRDSPNAARELLNEMRESLKASPETLRGIGKGRLSDIGPIILGHRLNTRESLGAYQTLIYNKGGLVLRMLHFLFTDPGSGNDEMFYAMMGDFVNRHANSAASTDDFREVANEHFVRTPLAQKYRLPNLDWFFQQWVYEAQLPSYRLEYRLRQDGTAVFVEGTVFQDNAAPEWFMPLPIVFEFDRNQFARTTVHVQGPSTPFTLKLPMAPRRVELDPDRWILSADTSARQAK